MLLTILQFIPILFLNTTYSLNIYLYIYIYIYYIYNRGGYRISLGGWGKIRPEKGVKTHSRTTSSFLIFILRLGIFKTI